MGEREMTDDKWQMANDKFSRKPQKESDGPLYAIESRLNVLRARVIAVKTIES
jgi:hypothetical protein